MLCCMPFLFTDSPLHIPEPHRRCGEMDKRAVCSERLWCFGCSPDVLTALWLCLSGLLCHAQSLGVCHAASSFCNSPKQVVLILKPICSIYPVGKKKKKKSHLSHSMPEEKCVTTSWQCETLGSPGQNLTQPYKPVCMQSVLTLRGTGLSAYGERIRKKNSHAEELQPVWRWIAPGSQGWGLRGSSK